MSSMMILMNFDETFWENMQELTGKIELFQFDDLLVESRELEGYVLEWL